MNDRSPHPTGPEVGDSLHVSLGRARLAAGQHRRPQLAGEGVAFDLEVPAATRAAVPVLEQPARRVLPQVQIGAPLLGRAGLRVGSAVRLPVVREVGCVHRTAVGARNQQHDQCPTAAAPFSPTRVPSVKRLSSKGLMSSGVVPFATQAAICSPDTGPALKP